MFEISKYKKVMSKYPFVYLKKYQMDLAQYQDVDIYEDKELKV